MNLCVQSGGFVPHFSFEEGYRKIAEAGFSSVDFNIDTAFNAGYLKTHMNQGACIYEKSLEDALKCEREILLAKITEEDIIAGKIVSPGSFTKRVISKLTVYRGTTEGMFLG